MSHDKTIVQPGAEGKIDRGMLRLLCLILMIVFSIGIGLYGTIAWDAWSGGAWYRF